MGREDGCDGRVGLERSVEIVGKLRGDAKAPDGFDVVWVVAEDVLGVHASLGKSTEADKGGSPVVVGDHAERNVDGVLRKRSKDLRVGNDCVLKVAPLIRRVPFLLSLQRLGILDPLKHRRRGFRCEVLASLLHRHVHSRSKRR